MANTGNESARSWRNIYDGIVFVYNVYHQLYQVGKRAVFKLTSTEKMSVIEYQVSSVNNCLKKKTRN